MQITPSEGGTFAQLWKNSQKGHDGKVASHRKKWWISKQTSQEAIGPFKTTRSFSESQKKPKNRGGV
jgi:hypothetical protein